MKNAIEQALKNGFVKESDELETNMYLGNRKTSGKFILHSAGYIKVIGTSRFFSIGGYYLPKTGEIKVIVER